MARRNCGRIGTVRAVQRAAIIISATRPMGCGNPGAKAGREAAGDAAGAGVRGEAGVEAAVSSKSSSIARAGRSR